MENTKESIFVGNSAERLDLLKQYNNQCEQDQIPQDRAKIPVVNHGDYISRRRKTRHIRAYHAQVVDYMMERVENCSCAFVLFDKDGCLIRLKGEDTLIKWLESKGICRGTLWNLQTTGGNAVTIGLKESISLVSVGEENYLDILSNVAIYFSPLIQQNFDKKLRFGGVAVFTKKEDQNDTFLLNTTSLADFLMIRIGMAYRTSASYDAVDARGMFCLDINVKNKSVTMTHHNKKIFEILDIPKLSYSEIYFKEAEEFFDPLPLNHRFWEIITRQEVVSDYEIEIYVRGRRKHFIISTEPYSQHNIKTSGLLIYITTKQHIARQISEKTSNLAIKSKVDIIGESNGIRTAVKKAKLYSSTQSNIMILGESGVGKDIFAQAIHNMSDRRDKPFVAVNCGALPRDLIASELFGYEGGAFTGARKQGNIGKFELANGGTLFLDEIGELPLDLQATLLRVVENKQFMRLGSNTLIHTDIKIVSATNANIHNMIEEKKFRADLFYRLGSMQLHIPPLRERGEDILLLSEFFIERIALRTGREIIPRLSEEAKNFLLTCPWRGNVRELQNVMECVVQLYPEDEITWQHLVENVDPAYLSGYTKPEKKIIPQKRVKVTKEAIEEAIESCGGNRSEAAKQLGIGRKTLYRYIDKYGI